MPIWGRKPGDCFRTFEEHVRPLIQGVLGQVVYIRFARTHERKRSMRLIGPTGSEWIRLESSNLGEVYLQLAQNLIANECADRSGFVLKTHQYWYRVYEQEPGSEDEPLLRWENGPLAEDQKHCKYHFHIGKLIRNGTQQSIELDRNGARINLTRLHIPTGYVLIEYVLRFLISDLGVTPACGAGWEDVLRKSETRFFTEFSPKA